MKKFLKKIIDKNNILDPPYEYDFLINLDPKEYPKYLAKGFKMKTGQDVNLKNPKTFNDKIQWIKLYDVTDLKTKLTDKVLVRDYVKEKIGEEYLKPLLQNCKKFDDIDFSKLPDKFIIKANHGCKWHYKIKDKEKFLLNKELMSFIKMRFDNWLSLNFFPFAEFEMQYKDIEPQLLIEPLLQYEDNPLEYEIYCFNGIPKVFQKIKYTNPPICTVFDENYQISDIKFNMNYIYREDTVSENLKLAVNLSKKLAGNFKLVRVDWLQFEEKLYFNEMTFTPYSGCFLFESKDINERLGNMVDLSKE